MEVHQQHKYERMDYYVSYIRNYRAVAVMWGIFTVCFAIINIVVFTQPQWIGDTEGSPGVGYFGLYQYCELFQTGQDAVCTGTFTEFSSIFSKAFQAATFFIGFSALITLICICCMLLFIFLKTDTVFKVCGWIQVLSGLCMFLGCVVYPAGWDGSPVQRVCGSDADSYLIGNCHVRWAYILAIIGIFDIFVLAILAFVLASRYARWNDYIANGGNISKSELNGYMIENESKPSIAIQPVLAVPDPDYMSEYSNNTKPRSRKGADFSL